MADDNQLLSQQDISDLILEHLSDERLQDNVLLAIGDNSIAMAQGMLNKWLRDRIETRKFLEDDPRRMKQVTCIIDSLLKLQLYIKGRPQNPDAPSSDDLKSAVETIASSIVKEVSRDK